MRGLAFKLDKTNVKKLTLVLDQCDMERGDLVIDIVISEDLMNEFFQFQERWAWFSFPESDIEYIGLVDRVIHKEDGYATVRCIHDPYKHPAIEWNKNDYIVTSQAGKKLNNLHTIGRG